ncbi:MAG TPA: iron-containing alcohol dehydrogenase [Vicinamibacterales bacterium]
MTGFDFQNRTRVVFGDGAVARLGELARELGFARTLLVADRGMVAVGYVERALQLLQAAGVTAVPFHDFAENPDTRMIEAGRAFAADHRVDSIVAIGGGSSLDAAKGINFLVTQGGAMQDYRGFGKAARPMLPAIGVPTTAGTGSEAQSYAIISDAETHVKMACGDPKAAFRIAILDPELTLSLPPRVTAIAGYDALSHAIESAVTTRRNALSSMYSREAFRLLASNYERVMASPADREARAAMLLGAHLAGTAIELSMLGAAHACANPLTARFGTTHGVAVSLMLPHVVRWNGESACELYADLLPPGTDGAHGAAETLALHIERLAAAAGLPRDLQAVGVPAAAFEQLAEDASTQMTGRFNPRRLDAAAARELYARAYAGK